MRAANSQLLGGHIVAWGRGRQLIGRLEDGRQIRASPLLEALEEAECPGAPIFNRPVRVCLYKHPTFHRVVWIGCPEKQTWQMGETQMGAGLEL